ncbi:MAG: NfeD family protein [Solirubrobacterales bacterium]
MRKRLRLVAILALCAAVWPCAGQFRADESAAASLVLRDSKAAVIPCKGMIDAALFYSIKRRTEAALKEGAQYLIYQISTYGGRVDSADDIAKYLIQSVAARGHTVAYVATEAISAGALISVSCEDVIMQENTTIGDAAPITMGEKLEGVEREKAESFVRAAFQRAAEANGYPELLLKAMVTVQIEVYRVRNLQTGKYEFFERDALPTDANQYDVKGAQEINGPDELLTLTASQAKEYGIARTVVADVNEALTFLADRDGVRFVGPPIVLQPSWSEHMVSWLSSPAVMGVLVMLALLGVYIEFSAPGFGLPGIVAIVCFAMIVGSKYLVGMANWVEIAILFVGIVLLLIELFVLPGFGIAGIFGIGLILLGLFGMLIRNAPGEFPWPKTPEDWRSLSAGALSLMLGFVGFVVLAWILSRYLPRMGFASGLILAPAVPGRGAGSQVSMTAPPENADQQLHVKDAGETVTRLRPAGKARFGEAVVDVVADGEFLDKGARVTIIAIQGSRVVVKPADSGGQA